MDSAARRTTVPEHASPVLADREGDAGARRLPWVCAGAAFLLYLSTLAPTVGWGDSADLATRMVTDAYATLVGPSRDYAVFRWFGGAFQRLPVGDAGYRANLMAAWFGALGVGIVAALAAALTGRALAAVGAAVCLALAHSYWMLSVTAEVYTFNAVLVGGAHLALLRWHDRGGAVPLALAGGVVGLALAHHSSGLVLLASVLPTLLHGRRRIDGLGVAGGLTALVVAALPYVQRVATARGYGEPWTAALGIYTPSNPLHDAAPAREAVKLCAYVAYNFPGLAGLLAAMGLVALARAPRTEWLRWSGPLLWAGGMALAGITTSIPDKFNIYVLVYPAVALLAGAGLDRAVGASASRARIGVALAVLGVSPPLTYALTVRASDTFGLDLVGARTVPFRDNATYFLWPPKNGDDGPRRYAEAALDSVASGGLLVADYTLFRPLLHLQLIEGRRPDVQLQFVERIMKHGVGTYLSWLPDDRPVYLAADGPASYYQLDRADAPRLCAEGAVYRVLRDPPADAGAAASQAGPSPVTTPP